MNTMREEFEAWAAGKGLPTKRDASGTYWSSTVEDRWEAYTAGQRAKSDECSKVCEAVRDQIAKYHWSMSEGAHRCALAIRARDKEQGC